MVEYKPVQFEHMPDALLMYCSDGRFFEAHEASAEKQGVKSQTRLPDRIVIPAPAYSIAEEPSRSVILPYVKGLVELHKCTVISINDHLNCGWMGAKVEGYKEADETGKVKIHTRYLKAAAEVLDRSIDNVRIETHLIGPEREMLLVNSIPSD